MHDETSATGGDMREPLRPDELRLAQLERLMVKLTERDLQEATHKKQARKARRRRERRRKQELGVSSARVSSDIVKPEPTEDQGGSPF
jgi:hypothetical protein